MIRSVELDSRFATVVHLGVRYGNSRNIPDKSIERPNGRGAASHNDADAGAEQRSLATVGPDQACRLTVAPADILDDPEYERVMDSPMKRARFAQRTHCLVDVARCA